MSNLVEWAKVELGRLVKDGDEMQTAINNDILEIVKVFSEQGHTGFTAPYALGMIKRLLDWKPITSITGEDDEWKEVMEGDIRKTQQNKRCSAVFRENFDNSTATYMYGKIFSDDGGETWFTNRDSSIPITFPYDVPEKSERIILDKTEE